MGVCTKIWTATAVLILAVSCILARPSGPEATDEQRESRTSNGFKLSSEMSSQIYDDNGKNGEHVIPVRVLFSDDRQNKPVAGFETLRQTEESHADGSVTVGPQHFEVTRNEQEGSMLSNFHNKNGDFNAGIRDENVRDALSLTEDFNSTPSEAQNGYKRVELTHGPHTSSSEGNSEHNDAKLNQHFGKSQSRDVTKTITGESHEKLKPQYPEVNVPNVDTLEKQKTIVLNGSSGRTFVPSNTRQITTPFENPILTYLTKQQSSDSESNSLDATSKQKVDKTPQNIRREVFHQQTIINPNPNIHQFLHPQTNPAYYQSQYSTAQQQLHSLPNTHFYTYPARVDSPGNIPYRDGFIQGQGNQNTLDSTRDELPQFQSNLKDSDNFVTTLTVFPAIASATYTKPTADFVRTSSVPLSSNTYQFQTNLPDMQSFAQQQLPGVPSPANFPQTRLIYNGLQYSSRIQWPLANYFPIVIKDPFLSMYNMFTSMVEYGPEADICKKAKSFRQGRNGLITSDEDKSVKSSEEGVDAKVLIMENGNWKEISKKGIPLPTDRKMPEDVTKEDKAESTDEMDRDEEGKKKDEDQRTEVIMETGGSGNAGPYITRLMVRKGGVSIAGPGGIATAGSGGTAIVGPGGVAYTSPNGLAVVGPGGKVVGLPSGADLSVLTSKVATSSSTNDGSTPRFFNVPPGGKVVATGPVVYFHPPE